MAIVAVLRRPHGAHGGRAHAGQSRVRARHWPATQNPKKASPKAGLFVVLSGDVLVSHTVPRAVPSALRGLTSGFGMEPGVSLSL